jgi:hypothetical protein
MDGKGMPKKSKTSIAKQKKVSERTVLKLWGEVVKERAGNKCEYPGCSINYTQLHPHHYFNRKNKSVKYDPDNGICLCHIHHTHGNEAAHLDPDFKEKWLKSGKRPNGWLKELTTKKNIIVKDNDDYRAMWKEQLLTELSSRTLPF